MNHIQYLFIVLLAYAARKPHYGEDDCRFTPVRSGREIVIRDWIIISLISLLLALGTMSSS